MGHRTLVIASLAAVGVAIGISVPMAMVALQGSHDLKFEYVKSGGVAGVNDNLTFDSQTGVISLFRKGSTNEADERVLSSAQMEEIRHMIANSGFFTMGSISPKAGSADYFSYSLTVTTEGVTHSVSWVDDSAAAEPVPRALKDITGKIEQDFTHASG